MKKIYTYILLMAISVVMSDAKPVSSVTAKYAASNFFNGIISDKSKDKAALLGNEALLLYDSKVSLSKDTLYYIFKTTTNSWIIMSGDDRYEPVIGYSTDSEFDKNNLPPSFISWIGNVSSSIEKVIMLPDNKNLSNIKYQSLLKNNPSEFLQSTKKAILPLIETRWNQGYPFNELCPKDVQTGQRAITGCVATAMAQLMYYHGFPDRGKGKNEYFLKEFGEIESDFSKSEYNYKLMKKTQQEYKDDESRNAVAKLMFDCGVSASMNYGLNASGASSQSAYNAMQQNFGFKGDFKSFKSNITDEEWQNLLYQNLELGLPMYYSGVNPNSGGHAFLCDGYENGNFHFNWGWGGMSDGYFYVSYNNSEQLFENSQRIFSMIIPSYLSLGKGSLDPDKYELNNTEERATVIKPVFENEKFSFSAFLNIHDTNDIDYFTIQLPEDENHYILDLVFNGTYNSNDDNQNYTTIKVILIYDNKTDTLISNRKQFILEKGGNIIVKVQPNYKIKYGSYSFSFNLYTYKQPFINFFELEEDEFYSSELVKLNWVSNLQPPFKIELIGDKNQQKIFDKKENINAYEMNWQLFSSLVEDNYYRFKISSQLDTNIFYITEPFYIRKKLYVQIVEPFSSSDVIQNFENIILWYTNFKENVTIELLKNSNFYQYIAVNIPNTEEFKWYISDTIPIGDNYRIKISKYDDNNIFVLSDEFEIQINTDVDDVKSNKILTVVDNQGTKHFIKLQNADSKSLCLYDLSGRKISDFNIPGSQDNLIWTFPDIPKGVYLIQEISDKNLITHKIIL